MNDLQDISRGLFTGTLLLLALSLGGCGDSGGGLVCGDGTTERGGQCVLDGEPFGSAGDDPTCGAGTELSVDGVCELAECVPFCMPFVLCGDDGCGGSCGECQQETPYCVAGGRGCSDVCEPDCEGKTCGPDGCGGSCGDCEESFTCGETTGQCVPPEWRCRLQTYGDGRLCDCLCGLADPDCDDRTLPIVSCVPAATCDAGECVLPEGLWICAEDRLGDGQYCDCGCGIPDPDCRIPEIPVVGCGDRGTCTPEGACQCTPECGDRLCGGDGCGGNCGTCAAALQCSPQGRCEACVPNCEGPEGLKECGTDGCGGNCGTCGDGLECGRGGLCVEACERQCDGKQCGDDGCGGSCGSCLVDQRCGTGGRCEACSCDGRRCGVDGCGVVCGLCGPGLLCDDQTFVCVESPCGFVTAVGCCDGDTARYCQQGDLPPIWWTPLS